MKWNMVFCVASALFVALATIAADGGAPRSNSRIRYIIETDAGGDPVGCRKPSGTPS
jgi:hypothetical protein